MRKLLSYIIVIVLITYPFITVLAVGIDDVSETNNTARSNNWSTTNPFVVFENGTSTQIIKEKKHTTNYWYSTHSFEISLEGTGQKITVPREKIIQDTPSEGIVLSTVFKTNWEKDILPNFNLSNLSGPIEFKIDAVIQMNGVNGLPRYCPPNGLYYDRDRVKLSNAGDKDEWNKRFNGMINLLNDNKNKILDFKNLTQGFINEFKSDLQTRGLPRIILDFNFNDPMTDLALCLRYNIKAVFNPSTTDYLTEIVHTGVENTSDKKANPTGSEVYTAVISYGAQDFKTADSLVAPMIITVENGDIVETIGAVRKSSCSVGGDLTFTPGTLLEWNNDSDTKVKSVDTISFKEAENGAMFSIDDPKSPKRFIIIKWKPHGTAPVHIVSRINLNSNNSTVKPEDPTKLANNAKEKEVKLSGSDCSTVILRTGMENSDKPDKTKKYQGIVEYSVTNYGQNDLIKPGIEVSIQNGRITSWGEPANTLETLKINENIDLTPGTLLDWQAKTGKIPVSINAGGSNYSWAGSAFNNGRSDIKTIGDYIKAGHEPYKLTVNGKTEYFKTGNSILKRYIYFTWQPVSDNDRVLLTSRIIPVGYDSDSTNNSFVAELNGTAVNNIIPNVTSGTIIFSPNDSSACNRYGWSNKDLEVTVHIEEGKESVTISGTDNRDYWTRERVCGRSEHSHSSSCYDENDKLICGRSSHTHSDSCYDNFRHESTQNYTQVWNSEKISSWGSGTFLPKDRYDNWGRITLKNNGISNLTGEIDNWLAGDKSWSSTGTVPYTGWSTWWDTGDTPKDTDNPFKVSENYKYHSISGVYKIDKSRPDTAGFLWDSQSVTGSRKDAYGAVCHEYMCAPDNTINVKFGDNLSGVVEARYLWSQSKAQPDADEMKIIHGLTTPEGEAGTVEYSISLHDNATAYWALRKGLWYLHIYQQDRAGNEIYTVSEPIYINKIGNFRINTIYDTDWKKYFRNADNTFTALAVEGITVKDMPVDQNKEHFGIKLGYSADMSIDTIGFDSTNSSIKISATYFGIDTNGDFQRVKVFAPEKSGQYVDISKTSSQYYSLAKEIKLDRRLMLTPDSTKPDYNTWAFNYFLPYNTRIVGINDPDPTVIYNARFTKLLVVFNITGEKVYNSANIRTMKYTELENSWSLDNGSVYGQSRPSGNDLLYFTDPPDPRYVNHGEVLWYDLTATIMDDIRKGRKW
jgi:hypothetical protein